MSSAIASLIPSGTDIAAALGLGDRLVGVSHECDHAIAEGKPVLTSSILDLTMTPGEIDAAVSASVADGHSLYRTDRPLLHELDPGLVLSQDVCDVCAVNGEVARGDVPEGAELIMLTAVRLAHLWEDLARVGRAAGVEATADRVIAQAKQDLDAVAESVAGVERPRIVALEWGDPYFIAGHWVPELIDLAGGVDALANPGEASRRVTPEEVAEADPDIVLLVPCGYSLERSVDEARGLPLADLRAVREGRFWAMDATRLFSRCTPQAVVSGARALASVMHPDRAGTPAPADAVRITLS